MVALQRKAASCHLLKVEADKKYEKKDWRGAAESYKDALEYTRDTWPDVTRLTQKHGADAVFQNAARVHFETNGARIKSNFIACHLQLATAELEKAVKGPKGPATDGDRLAALVEHFDLGPRETLDLLDDIFQDAVLALEGDEVVGFYWWKIHYREAQVEHCTLRYKHAMESIERARDMIDEPVGGNCTRASFYMSPDEKVKAHKLVDDLEVEVKKVIKAMTGKESLPNMDGVAQNVLGGYFSADFTPLGEVSPRLPKDTFKEEILAVRLLAAIDDSVKVTKQVVGDDGERVGVNVDYADEARELLNKILTVVAQPPFLLFPASGSADRAPPISVHLLAFYFRACLSKAGLEKLKIEEFCDKAAGWVSDEMAYDIATHAFKEVEEAHNPNRGHAKKLSQTGMGGCMPCACRIVRSGVTAEDWGGGLQMAAHNGRIEWLCFALNRLLEGTSEKSVYETILMRDEQACSTVMHAANDTHSRLCGTTLRLLAQAVAFSTPNSADKREKVRDILESEDDYGMFPALAAVSLRNSIAVAAFADLGARVWDNNNNDTSQNGITPAMKRGVVQSAEQSEDETLRKLVKTLQANTEERECCAYCGKTPRSRKKPLQACSRCGRAFYCDEKCQSRAYGKHKYVCTTASVSHDETWYSQNISMPQP